MILGTITTISRKWGKQRKYVVVAGFQAEFLNLSRPECGKGLVTMVTLWADRDYTKYSDALI
jgi:hypothetical protein